MLDEAQEDPIAPHDDYDLLTHYEASRRLRAEIAQQQVGGETVDGGEQRLAALHDAARRHRDHRPAELDTFYASSGERIRIDTLH